MLGDPAESIELAAQCACMPCSKRASARGICLRTPVRYARSSEFALPEESKKIVPLLWDYFLGDPYAEMLALVYVEFERWRELLRAEFRTHQPSNYKAGVSRSRLEAGVPASRA